MATLLIVEQRAGHPHGHVALRGVNRAKFRRQVVPGDRLRLEVTLGARNGPLVRVQGLASVEGQMVAEAELLLVVWPAARRSIRRRTCIRARGSATAPWSAPSP